MTAQSTLIAFAVGSAGIALWCDLRFRPLRPETLTAALVHAGAALLAGQLVVPLAFTLTSPSGPVAWKVTRLLTITLPALVYAFLAALWVMRHLQAVSRRN